MNNPTVAMKIDWQNPQTQDAALELYQSGRIRKHHDTQALISLLELQGCLAEESQDSYALTSRGQSTLPKLLDAFYPDWSTRADARKNMSNAEQDAFHRRLNVIQNNIRFDLPLWINQENYNTLYGGTPDADINAELATHLPDYKISPDTELRMKGSMDMHLKRKLQKPIRLGALQQMFSYVTIPQRDLLDINEVDGEQPYLVMTIESLPMFYDLDIPDHLLLIWTPPENPELAVHLLRLIPHYVPHIHFGDLEARSFSLAEHLAEETGRPLRRFLPDFWEEYSEIFAVPCSETEEKGCHWYQPISSHALTRELMMKRSWLPQNILLLDARMKQEMQALLS